MALDSAKKHTHKTKLDEAIFKATQSKPDPPKEKHDRTILFEARTARTASHIFSMLFQRPVGGKEIVLFKTLLIVHKLLRDGPENALEDCYQRKDYFESLKTQYDSVATPMGTIDHAFVSFLLTKLKFHRNHPDITGDVSLAKWKERNKKFKLKEMISLVDDLLDLQKSILLVQQKILQGTGLTDCRLSGLLTIIVESYNVYIMTEAFLKKLVDIEADVSGAVELFITQYPVIQKFYFNCSTIPFVSSRVPLPNLQAEPPSFKPSGKQKKKEGGKKENREKDPDLIDTSALSVPTIPTNFDPFASAPGTGNPFGNPNMNAFAQPQQPQQMLAFGGPSAGFFQSQSQQMLQQPMPQQPIPQPASQGFSDPFASLVISAQNMGGITGSTGGFNSPNPFGYDSAQAKSNSSVMSFSVMESRESLEKRIRELEFQVREVEMRIGDVTGKNSEIKRLLQDRTSAVSEVETQMRQRINHQQEQFAQANKELQSRLERMQAKFDQEKLVLLNEQVEFAKGSLEQQLAKFSDPAWQGNRGTTVDNIQQDLKTVAGNFGTLLKAIQDGSSGSVEACHALSDSTCQFLGDVKGALFQITNPVAKQQLASGAAAGTADVLRMLTHTKAIGQQGTKPDQGQIDFLNGEYNRLVQNLTVVNNTVQAVAGELRSSSSALELEAFAERELGKTSQYIQEASMHLGRHQELHKQRFNNQSSAGGSKVSEVDVESSILGGLLAITNSTKALVDAATQSQQERVKKASSGTSVGYHRDPSWTEGLIAAAQNVVKATEQLALVGEKVAQGQLDDQALISATRNLSAATTQLITASRAKSDTGSHANKLLDNAAATLTTATRALVEAAKSLKSPEHMAILQKSEQFAQSVIGEIEQQTKIVRLENEVAIAQKVLNNMKSTKQPPSDVFGMQIPQIVTNNPPTQLSFPSLSIPSQGQATNLFDMNSSTPTQQVSSSNPFLFG